MANRAIRGEACRSVTGVRGSLEIFLVTGDTRGAGQIVVVIDVAARARDRRVGAGQWKPRGAVVKVSLKPCIDVMARLAICRKAGLHVIRRHGALEIPHVAGIALRRQTRELSGRAALMAGDAIDRCVRTNQWEAIFMRTYGLKRHIPADYAVALFAICSELAAMNISVTVGTLSAYIAEDRLGMALGAFHPGMHAPQRIAGLVVIELGNRADRLPTCLRMAVLARNG